MKSLFLGSVSIVFICLSTAVIFAQQSEPKIINGGVLNGKATSLPKPEYPASAKAAHVEGMVRVEIIINEVGDVESAKAVRDDGDESGLSTEVLNAWTDLRAAAEQAAQAAKFSPTLLSGTPVKVRGNIVYNFTVGRVISGGVLNGKAAELPDPIYPDAAKAVSAAGTVTVQVLIDEDGNVVSAAAMSGHPLLQAAAVDAARQAKFTPTLLSGKPVKVSGVLTYNFVLPQKDQQ